MPPTIIDLNDTGADFVLKLLSEQKLNQVNVQFVIDAASNLINQSVKNHMLQVLSVLSANNIDCSCLDSLLESSMDPFVALHTQHGQNKYFAHHFGKAFF